MYCGLRKGRHRGKGMRQLVTAPLCRKQREMNAGVQLTVSFLCSQKPQQWDVLPGFRIFLPHIENPSPAHLEVRCFSDSRLCEDNNQIKRKASTQCLIVTAPQAFLPCEVSPCVYGACDSTSSWPVWASTGPLCPRILRRVYSTTSAPARTGEPLGTCLWSL